MEGVVQNQSQVESIMSEDDQVEICLDQKEDRKCGFWSQEEQVKYCIFAEFFREDLQSKHKRKFNKIFKTMAKFLKTRDAIQCRSHHMKQLRTLKKIRNIIKEVKKKVGEHNYRQLYQEIVSNSPIFKQAASRSLKHLRQANPETKTKEVSVQTIESFPIEKNIVKGTQDPMTPNFPLMMFPIWQTLQNPMLNNIQLS